jgi:hypothetical protein
MPPWEMASFGSMSAPNGGPEQDFDGDGISNLQEYLNETDPSDPANSFRIKRVTYDGAKVMVRFHSVTGRRYLLEQAASLSGPWSTSGAVLDGRGFPLTVTNVVSAGVFSQFYRMRELP